MLTKAAVDVLLAERLSFTNANLVAPFAKRALWLNNADLLLGAFLPSLQDLCLLVIDILLVVDFLYEYVIRIFILEILHYKLQPKDG